MALSTHTYYQLWLKMFEKLNIKVELSSTVTSSRIKAAGSKYSSSDFCFPLKTSIGHAADLVERDIPVFFPAMIAAEQSVKTAISFFCPYVESAPAVIKSTLRKNGIDLSSKMADPIIDLRLSVEKNGEIGRAHV